MIKIKSSINKKKVVVDVGKEGIPDECYNNFEFTYASIPTNQARIELMTDESSVLIHFTDGNKIRLKHDFLEDTEHGAIDSNRKLAEFLNECLPE